MHPELMLHLSRVRQAEFLAAAEVARMGAQRTRRRGRRNHTLRFSAVSGRRPSGREPTDGVTDDLRPDDQAVVVRPPRLELVQYRP